MLSIRKISGIGRTYRHLNRYRQILSIFIKYGFEDILERLNIDQYIEIGFQILKKQPIRFEKLTRAERIRMAIEELGPTYIKLGQVLSTRPDLLPNEFIKELSRLQDKVHPCPFSDIQKILQLELKKPLEEIFQHIDQTPLASASIGQVHKAWLISGEPVAVKIQRPGIRKIIEIDLEIMFHLSMLMEKHVKEIAIHQPVAIVEEFSKILEKELDYTIEASNMERFARQFMNDPTIHVPKVYMDLSTERVLTMEFIDGIKISEIEQIDAAGLDRSIITQHGANLFLKQVFDYGFFHADPHPGNIFVLPGNVICLLDFGFVGSIDSATREDFVELVECVVENDASHAVQVLLKLTIWENEPDIRILERETSEFMGRHLYKPLKDIEIGKLFHDLLDVASRHQLRIPPDLFFMMKAFSTIEGVALMLNPNFDMIEMTAPFIKKIIVARYSPQRISKDVIHLLGELIAFLRRFPKDSMEIARLVRRNRLLIRIDHQGLDALMTTHDRISNKLSFSIIAASLIIGSALIVLAKIPPLVFGISMLGMVMFFAAAIMGIWLLIAIMRKGGL